MASVIIKPVNTRRERREAYPGGSCGDVVVPNDVEPIAGHCVFYEQENGSS